MDADVVARASGAGGGARGCVWACCASFAADRRVALAGHDYFSLLVQLTLLAALTPLVRAVMLARKGEQLPVNSMCVAWLQVGAFTALEVVERLAASGTAVGLLHEPAVWVGLVAQVAVARVLCLGLRWVPRLAALWLRSAPRPVASAAVSLLQACGLGVPVASIALTPRSPRAPPCMRAAGV